MCVRAHGVHLLERETSFICGGFLYPFVPPSYLFTNSSLIHLPNQILVSLERLTVAAPLSAPLSPPSFALMVSVVLTCAPPSVSGLGPGLTPEAVYTISSSVFL